MKFRALLLSTVLVASFGSTSWAQEPGWWGVVIARGEQQVRIEQTPVLRRPYRPLHFYGNTVRRRYYRGTAAPRPRDFLRGSAALIARRSL